MKARSAIDALICTVRGRKVILDADLAAVYGVTTGALNQAVKRNADRFPDDFAFQLSRAEWAALISQIVISNGEAQDNQSVVFRRTASSKGGRRKLPWAFTEHGAIMAATILGSREAVAMSVFVVRAFIHMREAVAANAAILKRLAEIDRTLLRHDAALRDIYQKLLPLLQPPPDPPKRRIGFITDDK